MAGAPEPLLGYPCTESDNVYLMLGCGDIIGYYAWNWMQPASAPCPVHGSQCVTDAKAIITDGTSVRRT